MSAAKNGKLSERLAGALEYAVKACTIAGVLFAGWQFMQAKEDARIARTLEYVARFEHGDIGEARRRINNIMRAYLPQFVGMEQISAADRDSMVMTIVESESATLPQDIDSIADFFHGLATCMEENLCSRSVARNYFQNSDATDLWVNFEPYVRFRRENNASYAKEFEALAGGSS